MRVCAQFFSFHSHGRTCTEEYFNLVGGSTRVCGEQHSSVLYLVASLLAQSMADGDLKEVFAGFRDDTTLARATVVWKKGNGSSRQRLPLIRSCARLGRAEVVLELLLQNLRTEELCEDLFLDAVHGDKPTVSVFTRLGVRKNGQHTKYPIPGNRLPTAVARGL